MIVTPADLHHWTLIANTTRDLRGVMIANRPALLEVDGAVDDAIAAADEMLSGIAAVLDGLNQNLRRADDIEAGDRDPDGEPRPWPRPTP